jgi:branched-chain amino acid transport system ATP-binding protein
MLTVTGLVKRFGGLVAVDQVSFEVAESEIVGVIGPNGAGKSVLLDSISGFYVPNAGKVEFAGRDITGLKPHQISRLGMGRNFQSSVLFLAHSVSDNIYFASHQNYRTPPWKRIVRFPSALREEAELRARGDAVLDSLGIGHLKNEVAHNLPYGYQRILGVAIALAAKPRLLLLDEPLTGMNQNEIDLMVGIVRRIREMGGTIVLIEHNVGAVLKLCDRLIVLDAGKKIAEGDPQSVLENKQVVDAYLGKAG